MRPPPLYLALARGGEEPVAAGGASITPARANASIAIFQFPFSRFSILRSFLEVESRCGAAVVG